MNFELTADQIKLRATVEEFAQAEVAPRAEQLDREGKVPLDLVRKVGELGIPALPFAEENGGMGLGLMESALALEQLGRADQSLAITTMTNMSCGLVLEGFGHKDLVARYLPDIVAGKSCCGIGGTEPGAGSDTAGLKTRAEKKGAGWVLNGEKAFITNGGTDITAFLMFLGVTSERDAAKKQYSLFLVPSGTAGWTVGERYRKMGWRSSDTRPHYLSDCYVPDDNVVGKLHGGRHALHQVYQRARVFVSAISVGLAQSCLDHSLAFAKSRQAFGGPIGKFQLIQEMIAEMAIMVDTARLLTYRAAWNVDQGNNDLKELAMAKHYACTIGTKCADLAIQVHGGWGYMDDCPVSRYYRDNRVLTIGDGSSQIQILMIARALGLPSALE
jgi:short-chain 2-methylacyl-CoA dehydrogenase